VQGKDGGIALGGVAVNKDMKLVKQLLKAKTNVNVQDEDGEVALLVATNRDIELGQ
jgi:hypothetical protein